jgi:hypothetical protein
MTRLISTGYPATAGEGGWANPPAAMAEPRPCQNLHAPLIEAMVRALAPWRAPLGRDQWRILWQHHFTRSDIARLIGGVLAKHNWLTSSAA